MLFVYDGGAFVLHHFSHRVSKIETQALLRAFPGNTCSVTTLNIVLTGEITPFNLDTVIGNTLTL